MPESSQTNGHGAGDEVSECDCEKQAEEEEEGFQAHCLRVEDVLTRRLASRRHLGSAVRAPTQAGRNQRIRSRGTSGVLRSVLSGFARPAAPGAPEHEADGGGRSKAARGSSPASSVSRNQKASLLFAAMCQSYCPDRATWLRRWMDR